jgi:serine/threonine-protein kinase RIO1
MRQFRLTHNDMKPANLLFHNGQPTLIDLDAVHHHRTKFYFCYQHQRMTALFYNRLPKTEQKKPIPLLEENKKTVS